MAAFEKVLEHMLQTISFLTALWDFLWLMRCWFDLKDFGQTLQSKSFSVECRAWCFTRESLVVNVFWQMVHENTSFSGPEWTNLMCVLRCGRWRNFESQIVQENGFSPVWERIWIPRVLLWLNFCSHILHANGFSPVWVRSWLFTESFLLLQ